MKTLIVYYSLNGNTEFAVNGVSEKLGADKLRIEPKKLYPDKGFRKFLVGGRDAVRNKTPEIEAVNCDIAAYDRIIIASPVWASNITPPIRSFIEGNKDAMKGKRFACILCSAGGGTEKPLSRLKDALGVDSFDAELFLVDPKTRPNEGSAKLIEEFCGKL